MHKIVKRILVGVLVTSIVCGGGAGAYYYTSRNNQKEVMVIPVSSLYSETYSMDNNLSGSVATSVSQNVNLEKDTAVEEIFVSPGDRVKKGDKLIAFDMTIQEMEQNINKLTLQNYENNLEKAQKRLTSLQNGGPIEDGTVSDSDLYPMTSLPSGMDSSTDLTLAGDEESSLGMQSGMQMAAVFQQPLLLSFLEDGDLFLDGEGSAQTELPGDDGEFSEPADPDIENPPDQSPSEDLDELPLEPDGPSAAPSETPTVTPEVSPSPTPTPEPEQGSSDTLFEDGIPVLYKVLDEDSKSYKGTGTEEDPFVFLCSAEDERVFAKGTFMNLMAGFNAEGTAVIHEGGYWYRLEFYDELGFLNNMDNIGTDDSMMDGAETTDSIDTTLSMEGGSLDEELKKLCLGYYLQNGGLMTEPMRPQDQMEFTLENSTIPEQDSQDIPDDLISGDMNPVTSTISRAEAIRQQEQKIASLKLDIRKMNLEISKMEKTLKKQMVVSTVDGVVKSVGDPETGTYDGNAFLVVESDKGFYIQGTVSEMYLGQFKEGTIINGYAYDTGVRFEAEVRQISDYPVDGDASSGMVFYGYGGPNSNASSYEFIAYVTDQNVNLSSNQWINLSFKSESSDSSGLNISQAFVRTENGQSYVFKDDHGVLKKQTVKIGASKDGGYSVPVSGDISMNDKLAFPYGSDVEEGAKTREGTLDELYNMSMGF